MNKSQTMYLKYGKNVLNLQIRESQNATKKADQKSAFFVAPSDIISNLFKRT